MAKHNILDVILKTINDVQTKNKANPREETAHPNVFDMLKEKLGEVDKKIQNKRKRKGKKPLSILDLIKNQVEAARRYNKRDKETPTAPGAVFDRIIKKVEEKPKRAASSGIKRIIDEYDLDISRFPRETLFQIQGQYEHDIKQLNHKYAQAIHDLSKKM